jgi:hypothetical protein
MGKVIGVRVSGVITLYVLIWYHCICVEVTIHWCSYVTF